MATDKPVDQVIAEFRKGGKNPRNPTPTVPKDEWTVNGRPVAELENIPGVIIAWAETDQFRDERRRQLEAAGIPFSDNPAVVSGSREEGQVREFADFGQRMWEGEKREIHPWEARDPRAALLAQAANMPKDRVIRGGLDDGPGRKRVSVRMLSDDAVTRFGQRGWEIAKDEQGNPLKFGNLTAGFMLEETAKKRADYYREQANKKLAQVTAKQSAVENLAETALQFGNRAAAQALVREFAAQPGGASINGLSDDRA